MTKLDTDQPLLVYEVPEAGAMLGLSRNASYDAAKRGDIPTIRIGKLIRVPKLAFQRIEGDEGRLIACPKQKRPRQAAGHR